MHHFTHFRYDTEDHNHWQMTWREWLAVLGAALGAFMAILDIQITNASLREIQGSLGLDFSEGGWISTSYLIAEIVIIPLTGFLSEVFGMRRYIIANCSLFIVASILCGLSWNLSSMIAFRIFQGLVGGTLIPMAFQVILLFMPKDKKAIGMAIFGFTATMAPTLGPSLGGWLTDNYGWRLNFFINVLPGILMIFAIRYGIPNQLPNFEKLRKMDVSGTICLMLGLGSLTFILEDGARSGWFEDPVMQVACLVSISTLAMFFAIQVTKKNPLLNLRLLLNTNFALAAMITMIAGAALYGGIYALSLYLGQLQNYSATDIGQVMMWVGIPQLFVMPLLPVLMKRIDSRILAAVGMILFAWSNFLNAHLDLNYGGDQFKFSLLIRAIGQPLFMIPLSTIGMAMISPEETGDASSIFNMLRNLGGSIGIAIAGTFVISRQSLHYGRLLEQATPTNLNLTERLYYLKLFLRQHGFDTASAEQLSQKILTGIAVKESYIRSFSDIFVVLAVGLSFCCLLIFLIRGVKDAGKSFEMHE